MKLLFIAFAAVFLNGLAVYAETTTQATWLLTKLSPEAEISKQYAVLEIIQLRTNDNFIAADSDFEHTKKALAQVEEQFLKIPLHELKNSGDFKFHSATIRYQKERYLIPLGTFEYKTAIANQRVTISGRLEQVDYGFVLKDFHYLYLIDIDSVISKIYELSYSGQLNESKEYRLVACNLSQNSSNNPDTDKQIVAAGADSKN